MLNVLIADDERTIREGLAYNLDWEKFNMKIVGLAKDGKQALEMILEFMPDIVISDIKMPGMDGIQLITAVRDRKIDNIAFVFLSGYNEFTFAQETMKMGACDYLLKPINKEQIYKTLEKVKGSVEKQQKKDKLIKEMDILMEKQMPVIKEKFIRDYITNSYFEHEDFEYYKEFFDIENKKVRVVLYQLDNENNLEEMFSLKNLIEVKFKENNVFACLNIRNQVLLILNDYENDVDLIDALSSVNEFFHEFYDSSLQVIYTKPNPLNNLPYIYRQAYKCSKYSYYLNGEFILSMDDMLIEIDMRNDSPIINSDEIGDYISSGNVKKTKECINIYFENLQKTVLPVNVTKIYLTQLYMAIIKCAPQNQLDAYMSKLVEFSSIQSINEIKDFVSATALSITNNNYTIITNRHSQLITDVIEYVDEHLSNEDLNLKKVCTNVAFINADYFGRVFKKEMGMSLSQYVLKKRIEASKEMIANGSLERIYEIAEKVGFGGNAQYFSQMFKKVLGITPSEYKEKLNVK